MRSHRPPATAHSSIDGCFSSTIVHCLHTGSRSRTFYYTSAQTGYMQRCLHQIRAAQMGTQKVTGTLLAADLLEIGFSSIIYCSACTWVHQIKVILLGCAPSSFGIMSWNHRSITQIHNSRMLTPTMLYILLVSAIHYFEHDSCVSYSLVPGLTFLYCNA